MPQWSSLIQHDLRGGARPRRRLAAVLAPAGPHRSDRRARPAGSEAAAVPAPAVKARSSIPVINRTALARAFPGDALRRPVAWQEAIALPVPRRLMRHLAFLVFGAASLAPASNIDAATAMTTENPHCMDWRLVSDEDGRRARVSAETRSASA